MSLQYGAVYLVRLLSYKTATRFDKITFLSSRMLRLGRISTQEMGRIQRYENHQTRSKVCLRQVQ